MLAEEKTLWLIWTVTKNYAALTPGPNVIKLFTYVIYEFFK